jgi:hypothetical protein
MAKFTLAGRVFNLTREDFERAVGNVEPAPIRKYAIRIRGHRFPPKQVVSAATGVELSGYQTMEALRVLRAHGFYPDEAGVTSTTSVRAQRFRR